MYPFFRLFSTTIKSIASPKLDIHEMSETSFRCHPWDIDMFFEANNGRLITLYDLGRFDLAIRTGFIKMLKKERWGLVVAGSSIRYRRRVRMFDKMIMRTQFIGKDEKWFYLNQSIWVKGQPTSSVLFRTGVTCKNGTVPTEDVAKALNVKHWQTIDSDWLNTWISCEEKRPWPPK